TPAAHGTTDVFCLPGPAREMMPMFDGVVLARLRRDPGVVVRTRLLHTIGLGEGDVASRLGGLLARGREPQVGITVSDGVVTLRIRALGSSDAADAEAAVARDEGVIRDELGAHVFGVDGETLAAVVVKQLADRGRGLAVVESCTGGLLAEMITRVSGSSE